MSDPRLHEIHRHEAKGIAPLVMHSPLLSWAYDLLGERGFAAALGAAGEAFRVARATA